MEYISKKTNNLASSTLFCYNRGEKYMDKSYSLAIKKCTDDPNSDYVEGINYVYRIFKLLYNNFGYKTLIPDMNLKPDEAAKQFNYFNADIKES